jgi:hypothetical protein
MHFFLQISKTLGFLKLIQFIIFPGHPVATHVDELKGLIKVKGADRTLIEQFVYDFESGFTLCPN